MNSKLSNLNIPEIKSAAAGWADLSSLIEKITLHCYKRRYLSTPGPSYLLIFWVPNNIDVSHLPWKEPLKYEDGKPTGGRLKKQYRIKPSKEEKEEKIKGQKIKGRKIDTINSREIRKHEQYSLWNLLESIENELESSGSSFYQKDYEHPDPRFDFLRVPLNIDDEKKEFRPGGTDDPGGAYYDFDDTEVGRVVLFSREANVPTARKRSDTAWASW
jgi:hypothetical protein